MKKCTVLAVIVTALAGCTTNANKVADAALARAAAEQEKTTVNLERLAIQYLLEWKAEQLKTAVDTQDEAAALKVLEDGFTEFDKITALTRVQQERIAVLIRTGHTYVWDQRGLLNTIVEQLSNDSQP